MIKEVLNKIRNIRDSKGLTQDFIAIQLNMSGTNYSKIERGELPMTLEHLEIITKTLKVKPNELFELNSQVANEDGPGYKLQLITKEDLREFKDELLKELREVLGQSAAKNTPPDNIEL